MAQLKNTTISDTGFLQLPVGTTAQRPAPAAGQMRFNTNAGKAEFYNNSIGAWIGTAAAGVVATGGTVYDTDVEGTTYRVHVFTATGNSTFTVTKAGPVEYLMAAGGGGTAGDVGGAGGGGGVLTGVTTVTQQAYTVVAGSGGVGAPVGSANNLLSTNGGNSSAFGLTAVGGGRGGNYQNTGSIGDGGSGGGAPGGSGEYSGGLGIPGQGNNGGTHLAGASPQRSAGGGGAGGAGGNDSASGGGAGGIGVISFITGLSTFYAGGGGGGFSGTVGQNAGGAGGLGGGGNGKDRTTVNPGNSGTPNTGGGGGGNAHPHYGGASGGSGIVIIRYPLRQENPVTAAGKVVGDGVVLDLDFAKPTVYVGTGTTVSDSRLNGVTGTLVNAPVFANPRTHRSSFGLNNVNDYIVIPHNDKLSAEIFSNRKFCTLEGWVNVRFYENWSTVINKAFGGSFSNTTGPGLWVTSGGFRFVFGQGVSGNPTGGSTQLAFSTTTTNRWYYLVGTVNGNDMRFYVDGVLSENTTITTNPVEENTDTIVLGRRSAGNGPSLTGDIGMVRVYNRPLSATEVIQQYNATRWRFGV